MMEVTKTVLETKRSCQGRWKTGLSKEVENAEKVTMAMKGVLQTRDRVHLRQYQCQAHFQFDQYQCQAHFQFGQYRCQVQVQSVQSTTLDSASSLLNLATLFLLSGRRFSLLDHLCPSLRCSSQAEKSKNGRLPQFGQENGEFTPWQLRRWVVT